MAGCKNCSYDLSEYDNYCNNCGAKVIRNRLNFKNLLESFSEQFLNYDNKFLQTFIYLFKDPKDVIGSYLNGVRKKYVNVVSYFAIAITLSGLQIFILNKYFPEVMDLSTITAEGSEEIAKKNMEFVQEYQSIIMMLYVPIYALIAKLVFIRLNKFNYTELSVIFMYILSQVSLVTIVLTIALAFFGISLGTISLFLLPIQVIYSACCLKALYELSVEGIILRTLWFFIVLGIFFVLFMILFVFIMYKTGGLEEMIKNQQIRKGSSYIISSAINWTS